MIDYDDLEPIDRAFCDQYSLHAAHEYWAINGGMYACPGFSAEDEEALRVLYAQPPCEHGLAAHLCAGPGHYPMERDEEYF